MEDAMSTVDEVRREMWKGYWRLREHQLRIQQEIIIPLTKILWEKTIEAYPELAAHPDDAGQR